MTSEKRTDTHPHFNIFNYRDPQQLLGSASYPDKSGKWWIQIHSGEHRKIFQPLSRERITEASGGVRLMETSFRCEKNSSRERFPTSNGGKREWDKIRCIILALKVGGCREELYRTCHGGCHAGEWVRCFAGELRKYSSSSSSGGHPRIYFFRVSLRLPLQHGNHGISPLPWFSPGTQRMGYGHRDLIGKPWHDPHCFTRYTHHVDILLCVMPA